MDDDATQVTLLTVALEKTGRFQAVPFEDPVEASRFLMSEEPDGIITDVVMPQMSGLELVREARGEYPTVPILVLTGLTGEESAEQAFEAGATDFVTKPIQPKTVIARLERALDRVPVQEMILEAERRGSPSILGSHPLVEQVRETVTRIAAVSAAPTLILGESGTGKNLVARAIHDHSDRGRHRFVDVNCAALPDNLLEAEIFGYEKGAFTDAKKTKRGLAEVADGGTLFLDEIGTLPPALQAKLLTFLESRRFRRVGGTEDIPVDLRIVAATNAHLEEAVEEGRFRDDLYYRLNVATITLPPLRTIREDIGTLAEHFLERAAKDFGKPVPRLTDESVRRLEAYHWPGNARELRNIIERALIFSQGDTLQIGGLTPVAEGVEHDGADPILAPVAGGGGIPLGLTLDEAERRYIAATLAEHDGHVGDAAEALGVTRKVLWTRRKKHGMI